MRRIAKPSKLGRSIMIVLAFGYLVSPVAFSLLLFKQLDAGAFPPEADSIGIPIAGFVFLWLIGWLVIGVIAFAHSVWKNARRDKEKVVG